MTNEELVTKSRELLKKYQNDMLAYAEAFYKSELGVPCNQTNLIEPICEYLDKSPGLMMLLVERFCREVNSRKTENEIYQVYRKECDKDFHTLITNNDALSKHNDILIAKLNQMEKQIKADASKIKTYEKIKSKSDMRIHELRIKLRNARRAVML